MNADRQVRSTALRAENVRPCLDRLCVEAPRIGFRLYHLTIAGLRNSLAIVRTLSRTARVALFTVDVARDTP